MLVVSKINESKLRAQQLLKRHKCDKSLLALTVNTKICHRSSKCFIDTRLQSTNLQIETQTQLL